MPPPPPLPAPCPCPTHDISNVHGVYPGQKWGMSTAPQSGKEKKECCSVTPPPPNLEAVPAGYCMQMDARICTPPLGLSLMLCFFFVKVSDSGCQTSGAHDGAQTAGHRRPLVRPQRGCGGCKETDGRRRPFDGGDTTFGPPAEGGRPTAAGRWLAWKRGKALGQYFGTRKQKLWAL